MKKIVDIRYFVLLLMPLFALSCEDSVIRTEKFTANVPVYITKEELKAAVKVKLTADTPLQNPGKMYIYGTTLFINELYKGVHVIDNSDPKNPVKKAFIEIPANVDIAVRGTTLFADSYTDLVTIDISDLSNLHETSRLENVFQQFFPVWNQAYPLGEFDLNKGIIIGWKLEQVERSVEVNFNTNWSSREGDIFVSMSDKATNSGSAGYQASVVSTGGSMARFLLYNSYLYTVHETKLQVFDISNMLKPVKGAEVQTWFVVETIFRQGLNLFVGSTTGMLIFDISSPAAPKQLSTISHFRSCDPVVVSGNTAFVTLRGGNRCGDNLNQLQVYDVTTLTAPKFIKSYPMTGPYGLGIDNNILFICDGSDGLKIYDATDVNAITNNLLAHYKNINAYDVIPLSGTLLLIGSNGFYQYDYTDLQNIKLLSTIPVIGK